MFHIVPRAGLQPATPILEESCSNAAELPGHLFLLVDSMGFEPKLSGAALRVLVLDIAIKGS